MAPTAGGTAHSSARQAFSRLAVALLAAAGLGGWLAAPAEGQSNDDSTTCTVTFQGEWTTRSTPGGVDKELDGTTSHPSDLDELALFLATQPRLGPTGQSFSLLRS